MYLFAAKVSLFCAALLIYLGNFFSKTCHVGILLVSFRKNIISQKWDTKFMCNIADNDKHSCGYKIEQPNLVLSVYDKFISKYCQ